MTKEAFISALNTLSDNQALLDALESSKDLEEIARLLNAEGVAVTAEELAEFTADEGESELGENELDAVAGGGFISSLWNRICGCTSGGGGRGAFGGGGGGGR